MKTILKSQYLYLKSKKNADLLKNETVTIEDEEFEDLIQYSNKEIIPINNDYIEPEPIEQNIEDISNKTTKLTFKALSSGNIILNTNEKTYIPNLYINGIKKYFDSNLYYESSNNIFNFEINNGDNIHINYKSISYNINKNCYPIFNFTYSIFGNIISNVQKFSENIINYEKFDINKIYSWDIYINDFDVNCISNNVFVPNNLTFNIYDLNKLNEVE